MNVLIDAHLPRQLARWLQGRGHDVVHTRDLPYKLLLVSTGNIANDALISLFSQCIEEIEQSLVTNSYVEISRDAVIIHI